MDKDKPIQGTLALEVLCKYISMRDLPLFATIFFVSKCSSRINCLVGETYRNESLCLERNVNLRANFPSNFIRIQLITFEPLEPP